MTFEMQANSPFFTIIIPVFNRKDALRKALLSVQKQTIDDYECLIVDDGSKNSAEIKTEVEAMGDPRFYYYYQENGGACKARNHGIKKSKGKYIAFLDSDDQFIPTKLSEFHEILKNKKHNNVFCYSQLLVDRGSGKKWIKPVNGVRNNERMDEYLMCTHGWAQTSTQVLSTALALKVLFNEALPSSQDTDFAIRCCIENPDVVFIKKALTIMDDIYDSKRVSKQANYEALLKWINQCRGSVISEKAFWGYRGWQIARIASYNNRLKGLKFYLSSIARRPYTLKMSILVLAQIIIPQTTYQKIATLVVKALGKKNDK